MNFVLVHGGWCRGWWMSRLTRALQQSWGRGVRADLDRPQRTRASRFIGCWFDHAYFKTYLYSCAMPP